MPCLPARGDPFPRSPHSLFRNDYHIKIAIKDLPFVLTKFCNECPLAKITKVANNVLLNKNLI